MNNFKHKLTRFFKGNNFLSGILTALVLVCVIIVNAILYTLATRFDWYFTPADEPDLSISDSGDLLFRDALEKGLTVEVIFCMYEEDLKAHDTGNYVYRTAKEFEKKYPKLIKLNYINAITRLDSEGKPFDELSNYEKDMRGKETAINKTSVIFRTETNYFVLTDTYTGVGFADFYTLDASMNVTSYNGEEVFASLVSWVLKEDHGTAYVTVGHSESPDISLGNLLINAGYYVDELDLREGKVPEDADLVVIANPRNDFERSANPDVIQSEIERLEKFAERGGHFMVFLDPEAAKLPILEGFISEQFGISVRDNGEGERLTVKDPNSSIASDPYALIAKYADDPVADAMNDRTEHLDGKVVVSNAAPLSLSGNAKPLLVTSSAARTEAAGKTFDSDGDYVIAAYSTKNNPRAEDGKMFLVSSIYLTASDAMISNGYQNKDFLFSLFDIYFEKGAMPYGCNSIIFEEGVIENLTSGKAKLITAVIMAIPAVIAVVGAVVIIRRKNR